jgi:2-polyprenyl-3-methyl-5-hydroxy-6-metoxy-1,4-benzoquinol methylase
MSLITYPVCPSCRSAEISPALIAEDYTVSHESFQIWECATCTLRFTQQVPDSDSIGDYYKSENYISHTDTKKGFINSLYHMVRRRTLKTKKDLISNYTSLSGSLLDIGAGTGAFVSYMAEKNWKVKGLEPDAATRQRAKELYNIKLDATEALWQLPAGSFDAITMWHVLEHVHELHAYLEKIHELLKPEGSAFIALPNYTSFDARFYKSFWAAYDVPRHLYHFSPRAFKTLIGKHEFVLHEIVPMWWDSFYVSMLSEKYKNGKSKNIHAFFTGLRSNFATLNQREDCSSLIYIIRKRVKT